MTPASLRHAALRALTLRDPAEKLQAVAALGDALPVDAQAGLRTDAAVPGRPDSPVLVAPKQLRSRALHTLQGRAALIHSLAHIEFNAINLALDILWRFPAMPDAFYLDWARVAREEGHHFSLLSAHLGSLGLAYGDLPAHDGLWEMARRTQDDLLARLALVPRTLEARGLDASPVIRDKLAACGDDTGASILDVILADEIGHVAIGNQWYRFLCKQKGLEPVAHYAVLADRYRAPRLRGPFNVPARRAAGFTDEELAALEHDALGI